METSTATLKNAERFLHVAEMLYIVVLFLSTCPLSIVSNIYTDNSSKAFYITATVIYIFLCYLILRILRKFKKNTFICACICIFILIAVIVPFFILNYTYSENIYALIIDFVNNRKMELTLALTFMAFFCFFYTSVVYYFSEIKLRPLFLFILLIIPVTIRQYTDKNSGYLFLLLVTYFILCWSKKKGVVCLHKDKISPIIILVTSAVTLITFFIPYFNYTPAKKNLNNLNNDFYTQYLSSVTLNNTSENIDINTELFYVYGENPTYIKLAVYDIYNNLSDSNTAFETFEKSPNNLVDYYSYPDNSPLSVNFAKEIGKAKLQDNHDFKGSVTNKFMVNANAIYLSDYEFDNAAKQNTGTFAIKMLKNFSGQLPVANYTISVKSLPDKRDFPITKYINGEVTCDEELTYYEVSYDKRLIMKTLLNDMTINNYRNIAFNSEEYSAIKRLNTECNLAYSYLSSVDKNTATKINELSQQITGGYYDDYSKARAIENYFKNNHFIYDDKFIPDDADNYDTEDFIFETKRGVCTDFTAAMVLLCRSAGLPARFVSGFKITEENYDNDKGCYVVTGKDAHAYPEVFISGYGWMIFEPTVSKNNKSDQIFSHYTVIVLWLVAIFSVAIAIIIFCIYFGFRTELSESSFRFKLKRYKNEKYIQKLFQRIVYFLKKLKPELPTTLTTSEVSNILWNNFMFDFKEFKEIYDRCIYGEYGVSRWNLKRSFYIYNKLYHKLKKYI